MEVPSISEKKSTLKFPYLDTEVTLSGNFDSGNLNHAILDMEKNVLIIIYAGNFIVFRKR
jgi:hypothetical protein